MRFAETSASGYQTYNTRALYAYVRGFQYKRYIYDIHLIWQSQEASQAETND